MHGINVGEGGGEAFAVATRQPNNIISSPTGTSVDSTNQKLTHPSSSSPSLPCRPTATVHRQKIISNRDTGADFSNAVDPNGSRANAWREIFFFSFFLVSLFFFFRREEERWMDLEIGGGFEPCAHRLHGYTA